MRKASSRPDAKRVANSATHDNKWQIHGLFVILVGRKFRQCKVRCDDDDAPPQTKYYSVFGLLLLTYLVFLLIYLVDDQTRPDSIQLYFLKNISSSLYYNKIKVLSYPEKNVVH